MSLTTPRTSILLILAGAAVALSTAPAASAQAPLPSACPATFELLYDDTILALSIPAGSYQLTVLDPARLSCGQAADLFRQFLERWDATLPRPWTLDVPTATFTEGPGVGFSVARVGSPSGGGGGQHPATGLRCPASFRVLHNDRIGAFPVPAGAYALTLLSTGSLSCAAASSRFAAFLHDLDGRLPAPWRLDATTGTFRRGAAHVGFRVEAVAGPPAPSGGGVHPAGRRCPGTFSVLHSDRIGRLRVPAGRYVLTLGASGRPSCSLSARYLARFLRSGDVEPTWRVNVATGTFSGPGRSFRIKAAA